MSKGYYHIKHDSLEMPILVEGKKPSLQKLQSMVDGYIEFLQVKIDGKMKTMVINEEGLLRKMPINHIATSFVKQTYGNNTVPIVGNVVILEGYR